MKFPKLIFITLVAGLFFLSPKSVLAEVVVFREGSSCYSISLNENIIASKNGQPGPGCDFNVEVQPAGEWVATGDYFDSPPYAWINDSYYTSGRLNASFTCSNPTFALDQSSLPSFVQLIREEDLPADGGNVPGKRYHFSFAPVAPLGTSFNLGFSFQTDCQMKKKGGGTLTPVTKSSSGCSQQKEITINPRKANLNLPIIIGDACGTPTPPPPTATPQPTATPTPTITPGGPTLTPTPTSTPGGPPTVTPGGPPTVTPTLPPTPPTPTIYLVVFPTNPAGFVHPFSTARPSQSWRCLKSEPYNGPIMPEGKTDHRLKLSGDATGLTREVYIAGCINTKNGVKCTSGNAALDIKLSIDKDSSHFFIVHDGNPVNISAGSNTLEAIVYSHSVEFSTHTFYAVSILGPSLVNEDQGSSLQYGTFKFKQDSSKCTAVRWDPYGRVFDAQTLKPIADVKISLLDVNKKLVSLPGLKNPTTTDSQGVFHFLVEAGEYYLKPEPPEDYEFIDNPNLNPDYRNIYPNIYKPNEIIVEYPGKPELRDIPLSKTKAPKNTFFDQLLKQIISVFQ